MSNIVLLGMPGSGKSTVGVLAAKALGMAFLDTDLVLQQAENRLLVDLLMDKGVEAFLDLEADQVNRISPTNTIVSTGGSVVLRDRCMQHLQRLGTLVWLDVSLKAIKSRLGDWTRRGIAVREGQSLDDLYLERMPLYRKWSSLVITVDDQEELATTAAKLTAAVLAIPRANP